MKWAFTLLLSILLLGCGASNGIYSVFTDADVNKDISEFSADFEVVESIPRWTYYTAKHTPASSDGQFSSFDSVRLSYTYSDVSEEMSGISNFHGTVVVSAVPDAFLEQTKNQWKSRIDEDEPGNIVVTYDAFNDNTVIKIFAETGMITDASGTWNYQWVSENSLKFVIGCRSSFADKDGCRELVSHYIEQYPSILEK